MSNKNSTVSREGYPKFNIQVFLSINTWGTQSSNYLVFCLWLIFRSVFAASMLANRTMTILWAWLCIYKMLMRSDTAIASPSCKQTPNYMTVSTRTVESIYRLRLYSNSSSRWCSRARISYFRLISMLCAGILLNPHSKCRMCSTALRHSMASHSRGCAHKSTERLVSDRFADILWD